MNKIYTLILLLIVSFFSTAQVTLFSDTFTTSATKWNLGGVANNLDEWVVNNVYNCSPATPNQGGHYYMHIANPDLEGSCTVSAYLGLGSGTGGQLSTSMKNAISTVGQTAVSIKFDWLCKGATGILKSFGSIDYSKDGGGTWTNITTPIVEYSNQPTWTSTTITSSQVPDLLNQANLKIRFGFISSGSGTNPAFAIDNVLITGDGPTNMNTISESEKIDLNIFPNPACEELHISTNSLTGKGVITVFNIIGEKVCIFIKKGDVTETLNIKDLQAGVYFVNISTEQGSAFEKIVKK